MKLKEFAKEIGVHAVVDGQPLRLILCLMILIFVCLFLTALIIFVQPSINNNAENIKMVFGMLMIGLFIALFLSMASFSSKITKRERDQLYEIVDNKLLTMIDKEIIIKNLKSAEEFSSVQTFIRDINYEYQKNNIREKEFKRPLKYPFFILTRKLFKKEIICYSCEEKHPTVS